MIEIIEIIWKHSEAPPLADIKGAPTSAEKTTDDDGGVSTPPTVDVGGASFSVTKLLAIDDEIDDGRLGAESLSASMLLVARGVSHLSYFYVGVVSSVLYLDPASTNNDAVLFRDVDILDEGQHHDNDGRQLRRRDDDHRTPMALEIHYHVPARASDLRWATRRLAEANMPGPHRGKMIDDLPPNVMRGVRDFVDMYRDVRPGDRYTLAYVPGRGLSLSLNDVRLGTIGIGMGGGGNDDNDDDDDGDDDDDDVPGDTADGGEEREERELARIVYGVWFGADAPFSVPMRDELLTTPAMLRLPSHGRGATTTTTTTTTDEEAAGAAPPDPPITSSGDATFGHTAGTTTIVALVAIALSLWSKRGGGRRRGVSSPIVIGSCGETRIKTLQRVVGGVEQQHWHRR